MLQLILKVRRSGMNSHQAILPDALRVYANLFQTDFCGNPEPEKACKQSIHGVWLPAIHAGMTAAEASL